MTLQEAIDLGYKGDLDAIMALGRYYFGEESDEENRDINEAIKWYVKGAEFGYANCMFLASITLTMSAHALRKIGGASTALDAIKELNQAKVWAEKALKANFDGADKQLISVKGELGIAYYYYALGDEFTHPTQQESIERYEISIDLLKSVYMQTTDREVYIILALALNDYGKIVGYSMENNSLEYQLYHKCADEYFGEVIHSDIAACFLGIMYTEGRGCDVDYDKAVYYFQKAHNAGFDCSDMLGRFKKKMFGGYTLK